MGSGHRPGALSHEEPLIASAMNSLLLHDVDDRTPTLACTLWAHFARRRRDLAAQPYHPRRRGDRCEVI